MNRMTVYLPKGDVVQGKLTVSEQARLRQVARDCGVTSTHGLADLRQGSFWALLRAIAAGQVVAQPRDLAGAAVEAVNRGCPVEKD